MADTVLRAPTWSFVQLSDFAPAYDCVPNYGICLPLKNMTQLNFQMYALSLSSSPAIGYTLRTIFAYPVPIDVLCDKTTSIPDLLVHPIEARLELISDVTGVEAVLFFDDVNVNLFEDAPNSDGVIQVGDCFKFMLVEIWRKPAEPEVIHTKTVLGCTNCFIRVSEDCYYTELTYRGNENHFDFYYMEGTTDMSFDNKILLPLYFKNPQLPSEENSYRKSNGVYIKLSQRIEEELEMETDYFSMDWHRKLKVALSEDTIVIFNANYADMIPMGGDIVCKENYEILPNDDAPGGYSLLRKAKTKVKISEALAFTNSNCQ